MNRFFFSSILILLVFMACNVGKKVSKNHIMELEMSLSAFGVESDAFPSIDVFIDFQKDSSYCHKSYYNPAYKSSVYHLSKREIRSVLKLLENADLGKLKTEYRVSKTDQPSSETKIYANSKMYVIDDYGLQGDAPLQELYEIVYKY